MQALTVLLYAGLALCANGLAGGKDALPGKHPFHVSLRFMGKHNCNGAILNKRYVLTSANCLRGARKEYMTVVTGVNRFRETGTEYKVESYLLHPDLNPFKPSNNIGLIKVEKDIEFNDKSPTHRTSY
ncbi:chymotrypsin-2-like [Prorops nasuta]|uniref:chymotrypsin-2-like n=1 Tax=Prorops nasuta TaxID=863751 RepID=UPI0034D01022